MGADQAVHLFDPLFDGLDNFQIAKVLATAIQKKPFDLVLCGRQAVDDDMAQVGPALAIFLKIPFLTIVTKIKFSENFQKHNESTNAQTPSDMRTRPTLTMPLEKSKKSTARPCTLPTARRKNSTQSSPQRATKYSYPSSRAKLCHSKITNLGSTNGWFSQVGPAFTFPVSSTLTPHLI